MENNEVQKVVYIKPKTMITFELLLAIGLALLFLTGIFQLVYDIKDVVHIQDLLKIGGETNLEIKDLLIEGIVSVIREFVFLFVEGIGMCVCLSIHDKKNKEYNTQRLNEISKSVKS